MLDMGFIHDIKRVLALLPPKRQNLLFSATFTDEIKRARRQAAQQAAVIEVARRNADRRGRSRRRVHPGRSRSEEGAARAPDQQPRLAPGAGLHAHEARREPARRVLRTSRASPRSRSTATRARARARRRSPSSSAASCRCWSRPTSRRAASTSTSCRTSSTSSCRTCPRTTCTASAAPAARARSGEAISLVCVDEEGFLRRHREADQEAHHRATSNAASSPIHAPWPSRSASAARH